MNPAHPAFGQADLTNCERELIHLAGSVQPHGCLMAVREPELCVVQASENALEALGGPSSGLLGRTLASLGGDLEATVRSAIAAAGAQWIDPIPIDCQVGTAAQARAFEGVVHRAPGGLIVIELEPVETSASSAPTVDLAGDVLIAQLGQAVERIAAASTTGTLADAVVRAVRDLTGYDRVMVYKFDPDGHGKIIAEARDPRLASLLGHHYPATDIPQRARELYVRNRVRMLVDVHAPASPLVPQREPGTEAELDMSMCQLRSMSPLHLQYLKNMGVTATLVASLVREGGLWGLIACHHNAPRHLRRALRSAVELLSEVIATRIVAIENYAHAQVAMQVRRLEQRLVEATSTEGDWRLALFRHPHTLLQPLDATGAALFHEGEVLSIGEVPSTPELRALMQWVEGQKDHVGDAPFACSSVSRAEPGLDSLTPTASGVLAVKISQSRPEYLMWFRKEQLQSVTWAGDPSKPTVGDDPLELSPRRSFAAWSEIVRGTALPWTTGEVALARAFGAALVDIIVQIHAVRMLIAEHQLVQVRATMAHSREAVIVAGAGRQVLFANEAFHQLTGRPEEARVSLDEMATLFTQPDEVNRMLASLARERQSWRGALSLDLGGGRTLPVAVRAEVVPARDGSLLGFFLVFADLSDQQRAAAARAQLEESLFQAGRIGEAFEDSTRPASPPRQLITAIIANASLAAMDIADGDATPSIAPLLQELEASTQRAASLFERLRRRAAGRA